MPKIFFYTGLPASGKTTDAKKCLLKEHNKVKRVNKDDLRAMLDAGKWSPEAEKFIEKARDILLALILDEGMDAICDDTNLVTRHLARIDQIANEHKACVHIKDFTEVPVEQCVIRDMQRQASVGRKVIMDMYERYLKPKRETPIYAAGKPHAIICDIDGTLAHINGRNVYDYTKVYTDLVDPTVKEVIRRYLYSTPVHRLIIVSGRDDSCREETEQWLKSYTIPYDRLLLRRTGDRRSDEVVKKELYEECIKGKFNIDFVIDDRLRVCRMWYQLGLPLFRVGDPDASF